MTIIAEAKDIERLNLKKDEIVKFDDFSIKVPKGWSYKRTGAAQVDKPIKEWIELSPINDFVSAQVSMGVVVASPGMINCKAIYEKNKSNGARVTKKTMDGHPWEIIEYAEETTPGTLVEKLCSIVKLKEQDLVMSASLAKSDKNFAIDKKIVDEILSSILIGKSKTK